MKWAISDKEQLRHLVNQGKTSAEIAPIMKRSWSSIKNAMHLFSIKSQIPRFQSARKYEEEAYKMLETKGFQILEKGYGPSAFDILVSKQGQTFAVNVKFVDHTTDNIASLRQLHNMSRYGIPVFLVRNNSEWIWLEAHKE